MTTVNDDSVCINNINNINNAKAQGLGAGERQSRNQKPHRTLSDSELIPRDRPKVETLSMEWGYKGGGYRHFMYDLEPWQSYPEQLPGENHGEWLATWPADYHWPPENYGTWEAWNDFGEYDSGPEPPPDIPLEVCSVGDVQREPLADFDYDGYARSARSNYKLRTGGKAMRRRSNLFSFYCSAERIRSVRWRPPETMSNMPDKEGIPPSKIRLLGQTVGSDGYVYKVLPDNSPPIDITPQASVNFYTFGVSPTKHNLTIWANGLRLDPDRVRAYAKFCVGQKVSFEPVFEPAVPGLKRRSTEWAFSGQYVNYGLQNNRGCKTYHVSEALLRRESTAAWWVTGSTTYQGKTALVDLDLTFDNAQRARVSMRGLLGMYEPQTRFNPALPPSDAHGVMDGNSLKLDNEAMEFHVQIWSDFGGYAYYTQLCRINMITDGVGGGASRSTGSQYFLDNSNPYSTPIAELGVRAWKDTELRDGPSSPGGWSAISVDDHFKDYLMFQPPGDENIAVPVAKLTWYWTSSALKQGGQWIINGDTCPPPVLLPGPSEFPFWTLRYDDNWFESD